VVARQSFEGLDDGRAEAWYMHVEFWDVDASLPCGLAGWGKSGWETLQSESLSAWFFAACGKVNGQQVFFRARDSVAARECWES